MLRQYSYIGFQEKRQETSTSFNFTFYCADDVLPLNNYKFVDYVDRIYPTEFKIKNTINTAWLTSQLDLA